MRRILVVVVLAVGAVVATQAAALAAPTPGVGDNGEFLCPIVGDGVTHADSVNNDNGVSTIAPAPGVSLLPGGNQAGNNANSNALNDLPPNNPDAGPGGGNSGFGAIWPTGG
jgi:opacity protein-like surface antigen